jgi:formylglycine-generating enzyme required for sulfatase activity
VLQGKLSAEFDVWRERIASGKGLSRFQELELERDAAVHNTRVRSFKSSVAALLAGAVVGAAVGATGVAVRLRVPERSSPHGAQRSTDHESPRDTRTPTATTVIEAPPSRPPEVDEPSSSAPDASALVVLGSDSGQALRCPVETLRIPATEIARLDPPSPRPYWPANQSARSVRVGSFCLSRSMVTAAEFANCVAVGRCVWAGRAEGGSQPATHLHAAQADAYCRWRGANVALEGALPSITEWESAGRQGRRSGTVELRAAPQFEWVSDPAFPALWAMRTRVGDRMTRGGRFTNQADTSPVWSWNPEASPDGRQEKSRPSCCASVG